MLTEKEFNDLKSGETFATGVLPNSPEGLFMTRNGGELRWVGIKGYANDWSIYCHWVDNSVEWIKRHGDKVINEHHIKKCVPCDELVFKKYRY